MNHCQRHQIREAGDDEDGHVAARTLENLANNERDQHAADRSGHAADADNRAHGPAGEHIGGEREEVGRPALMRRRGQRDLPNRQPMT